MSIENRERIEKLEKELNEAWERVEALENLTFHLKK
jgi:predicted RNase H-like nuclease (RuvC/YqgF family)